MPASHVAPKLSPFRPRGAPKIRCKHCTTTYDTFRGPQLTVGAAHELETSVLHGHPVLENGEVILKSFSVLVNVVQVIENLENFYN